MSRVRASTQRCFGWLMVAALSLPAGSVGAAQILDVRVALHPGFTRVVFDTDVPTAYRIEPARPAGGEIRIHLEAEALLREAYLPGAASPAVLLEPTAGGTLARIPAPGPILIESQQLERPPRVVLDLRARRASAAPAPAAAVSPPPDAAPFTPSPPPAPPVATAVTPAPTATPPPAVTPAPTPPDPAPAVSALPAKRGARVTPDVSAPPARSTISRSQRRVVRPVLVPKKWVKFIGFAWISLLALALLRRLRQRRLQSPPEFHPNVRRRLGLEDAEPLPPLRPDGSPERPASRPAPISELTPERPTPWHASEGVSARLTASPAQEDDLAMRDLIQMIQRLDDRLARVETHLEAMDRDRGGLARQTAAQADELRSQRAALTRLQRLLLRPRPAAPRSPTP